MSGTLMCSCRQLSYVKKTGFILRRAFLSTKRKPGVNPSSASQNLCKTLWCRYQFVLERKCASIPPHVLPAGTCSLPGRNKGNEDRFGHFALAPNIQYFGVYDGHNGTFVSQFVHKNLPRIIENRFKAAGSALYDDIFSVVEAILIGSFHHCQTILAETMVMMKYIDKREMTGSTAVVGILIDNKYLTIANIGDSQALLCRGERAVELSVNHNPENVREAERVLKVGGWIDWDSKVRPMVNGRLSLTRSFGNMLLKPDIVTCHPYVRHEILNCATDSFLVLCSDGVTHTISSQEIMFIVSQHDNAKDAAEDLATSAQQFGSDDDITAVVVPLDAWRCFDVRSSTAGYSLFRTMMGNRADG